MKPNSAFWAVIAVLGLILTGIFVVIFNNQQFMGP